MWYFASFKSHIPRNKVRFTHVSGTGGLSSVLRTVRLTPAAASECTATASADVLDQSPALDNPS